MIAWQCYRLILYHYCYYFFCFWILVWFCQGTFWVCTQNVKFQWFSAAVMMYLNLYQSLKNLDGQSETENIPWYLKRTFSYNTCDTGGQNRTITNFGGYILYLWPEQHHLRPSWARGQMILRETQINYMPSKSHLIILLSILKAKSCKFI